MAKKISEMGGKIIYNACVSKINLKDGQIESLVAGDKEYKADAYVSSMAIKDLYECFGESSVDSKVYEVATNLMYRDFITVGLLVSKLEIENNTKIPTLNKAVPDCWIYIQERDVKVGRLQIFNNWSPYMVKDYENSMFVGLEYFANEGDELWNMPEEEFKEMAVKELLQINVIESEEDVIDKCEFKVKKAYPGYFDTYKDFDILKKYLLTIDNLFLVGRNGQHRYNNMDHSMLTGMIAADYIIEGKTDKSELWNVNAEKEYHESK